MNDFKDMLVYLRQREHLTQRELAKKLNVSPATIGMYETGKRFPTREIEEAIADLFNVNIDTLRGNSRTSNYSFSDEDQKLLMAYHMAPVDVQNTIKRLLAYVGSLTDED